ncbi:MAG TPA: peptidyl-prolyl cis-trans isomerase [Vicinamibacterales bacterium]|mgnify:CR=1 FL=1|nr:peptidyl-prolyl cis-trans isomerase [Vicinamibacterales bacterium]HPK71114.1 peptidyl-prolyl cis-trans isomerase [Vicinamibacterales bacterium]HPW20258.1 peptidyl-prolyl cis-trans isomerase [Vicinamibacterales bacterium]
MRYQVAAAGLLLLSAYAGGAAQPLPVRAGRPAAAAVGGDLIFLDELVRELGPSADRARLQQGLGTAADLELLGRLVNIRLIVQEAATMGIAELPEIRKQVEVGSREILREVLLEQLVKDVKADPAVVDSLVREAVREWKTTSLLFQDEAAARRARKEIADGASFADVASRAVAAKAAKTDGDSSYHARGDYLPAIAQAVAALKPGEVSPVVRIQAGFVILTVLDIRYPERPEARAEAQRQALSRAQVAFMTAREQDLKRKYVTVNEAVLKGLDYQAPKPGLDALLKDPRVVARIKGAAPVTVADLTDYLRMQFFHGGDRASQFRRMNERKEEALQATIGRRLLNMEALRLGIDKTNAYRDRVRGYQDTLVFERFVQRAIAPENKMREEEVRRYYDGHIKDYSSPGMLRLRGIAFARRTAAEDAMRKLQQGADFGWLAANAAGQADKGAAALLSFDGRPVTISSMPAGLQKALAGAKTGESRLYASPEGHYYVVSVRQAIDSQPRPYADVREEIARKLYDEKITKGVEEYAARLRAHSKVEIYLKRMR